MSSENLLQIEVFPAAPLPRRITLYCIFSGAVESSLSSSDDEKANADDISRTRGVKECSLESNFYNKKKAIKGSKEGPGGLLTKSEVDVEAKCVKAEIIEYERNDPKGGETKLERALPPGVRRKRKTCIIS